ncbi:MAG: pyridoxamine 5'-phosphate oxidase family protein [Acidimicrobiia bacterium]|nr:pyridoxamine 5'-phosphate oxidase family protein [Acidimicrobiia bacterium]
MPRLTAPEIERLLTRNGIVHLAVVTDDGSPLVVPLAYVYRDRQILLTARERVSWLDHIRREPRVCLSIDSPRYPLAKVTVRGEAQIVFEPGDDDQWRDRRVPLAVDDHRGPLVVHPDGREEWTLDEVYRQMTHDEPRALVAVDLDRSRVTSWRLPTVGEPASEVWASRYFRGDGLRRFAVSEVSGWTMADVRVVSTPDGA